MKLRLHSYVQLQNSTYKLLLAMIPPTLPCRSIGTAPNVGDIQCDDSIMYKTQSCSAVWPTSILVRIVFFGGHAYMQILLVFFVKKKGGGANLHLLLKWSKQTNKRKKHFDNHCFKVHLFVRKCALVSKYTYFCLIHTKKVFFFIRNCLRNKSMQFITETKLY